MQVEHVDGVGVVRMKHGGANAMNTDFFAALESAVGRVESSPARALLLTGHGRFFSAGLDLPLVVDLTRDELRAFVRQFSSAMMRVCSVAMPVVAAINGHAIAGGCILALQCDERVMIDDARAKIGLNEVQLGLGLPQFAVEMVQMRVPAAHWRRVLRTGALMSPADALGAELVDELAPGHELEARAMDRAIELASLPPLASANIKRGLRRPVLERVLARFEEDAEALSRTIESDDAQRLLRAAAEGLSR